MSTARLDELLVVGCSHQVAPVEVRERIFPDAARLDALFQDARSGALPVRELVVLYTCSRIECYAVSSRPEEAAAALRSWLLNGETELAAATFVHRGGASVRHILSVAAGLDSIMVGEHEVLGQIRDSLEQSRARGTVGPVLDQLVQTALRTGRRARNETDIGKGGTSLAFAAADLTRRDIPPSQRERVVVVGAGATGALAAIHLKEAGWREVLIVNRTLARAREVAERVGGRAHPLEDLRWAVRGARAVVTAVQCAEPVLTAEHLTDRAERPLVVVDLGRPRNVDPALGARAGVRLFDLDDLSRVTETYRRKRLREVPKVEPIVADGEAHFRGWLAHRQVVPLVRTMRQSFEELARAELERAAPQFSEEDRAKLEAYTHRLVRKLLHHPTVGLKELAEAHQGDEERILAIQEIFAAAGWGGGAPAAKA